MLLNNFASAFAVPSDKVPLLDYKWSVTLNKPDGRELLDYGKGHSNGKLYFGRGLKQNGTDQTFTIPINDTINTIAYFENGSLVVDETVRTLDDYVSDVNKDSVFQNYIFYKGVFTLEQKEYLEKYPEKFLYSVSTTQSDGSKTYALQSEILTQDELDSVVAYLPMCETDSFLSVFKPTSLEFVEIDNFTDDMRVVNLTYGLQTCFLKRDSKGVPYDSSFTTIQHDGIGYIDTKYIPDGIYTIEEVVEIDGHTTHIFYDENGNKTINGTDVETYQLRTDNLLVQKTVDGVTTTVHRAFKVMDKELNAGEAYKEALRTVFPLLVDSDGIKLLDSADNYLTA